VDRDFGKSLENLPALRQVGFQANGRLLDVQNARCSPAAPRAAALE
jgi:hypothetical protein